MNNFNSALKSFWQYMWHLNNQTKKLLRLDFTAVAHMSKEKLNEKERELADEILPEGTADSGGNGNGKSPLDVDGNYGTRQKIGLFLGPILFLLFLLLPTPEGLTPEAKAVAASTAWIATWWISEAIPIPATSLMPIVLFPLTGVMSTPNATAPYGNHLIFLFMGGFLIAVCMEKWNLHRRIALGIIRIVGTGPNRLILGFMVATGFLSMWISNTATAMMMMPIGLAVILQVAIIIKDNNVKGVDVRQGKFNFGTALMLGIAYGASIGGVATLIGTPPNTLFAGAAEELFGQDIGFAQWMVYGVPIAALLMIIAWVYLVKIAYPVELKELPGGKEVIDKEIAKLGGWTKPEKQVLTVFSIVALAWITRTFIINDYFPMINDSSIAIMGAVVLFLIPVNLEKGEFLLDWSTAVKIPWGIILLFGGGLSIAAGFGSSGLAEWIGLQLSALEGASMIIIVLAVVTLTIFLTEVTSNTATATMLMPVMAAMASAMGVHPYILMIAAATACSFAFMLPVATPPNAVVFGSGYITIPQMVKAGIGLNIIGIILITILTYLLIPIAWGIDINVFPAGWL